MPTEGLFSTITRRYGGVIDSLIKTADDIISTDNYKKYLSDLDVAKKKKADYTRFKTLNSQIFNSKISPTELVTSKIGVDETSSAVQETGAYKQFKGAGGKDGEFNSFLDKSPDLMKELNDKSLVYTQTVPLGEKDLSAKLYEKGKFTAEDINFYESYKDKTISPEEFNTTLLYGITAKAPSMISSGALGNKLYENALQQTQLAMLTIPKYEYKEVDGSLVQIDQFGNVKPVFQGKDKELYKHQLDLMYDKKNWVMDAKDATYLDDNGETQKTKKAIWVYHAPDGKGGFVKQKAADLTADEYADSQYQSQFNTLKLDNMQLQNLTLQKRLSTIGNGGKGKGNGNGDGNGRIGEDGKPINSKTNNYDFKKEFSYINQLAEERYAKVSPFGKQNEASQYADAYLSDFNKNPKKWNAQMLLVADADLEQRFGVKGLFTSEYNKKKQNKK